MRFTLTVHDMTKTQLAKLYALADRFLKKWLHVPKSGTLAPFHSPKMLNITTLTRLFNETRSIAYANSRLNADSTVNNVNVNVNVILSARIYASIFSDTLQTV